MVGFPCLPGEHAMVACVKLNVTSKTRRKGCHCCSATPHCSEQGSCHSSPSSGQMALEVPQGTGPRADGTEGSVPCLVKPMTF